MTEAAVKRKLYELLHILAAFPETGKPGGASQGLYVSHGSGDKDSAEQALDLLRLQMKYLLFDLEATRRENRYLRQMLRSRPPGEEGGGSGE